MRTSKGPEGAQVHGPSKVHPRGLADSWLSYGLSYLGSHGSLVNLQLLKRGHTTPICKKGKEEDSGSQAGQSYLCAPQHRSLK